MSDHIIRMLAATLAFERGESLANVEDFVREKDFVLEFHALEQTLKAEAGFLTAYTVCHDLAKAESLIFDAAPGSKGADEGFLVQDSNLKLASKDEILRFDKLRRAHGVTSTSHDFYDVYKIAAHYPEHSRKAAADEFASTREAVMTELHQPAAKSKLLNETIRLHMEAINAFKDGPNPAKYHALAAIADRVGLNQTVFLDMLPAAIFLDAIVGSLVYVDGKYSADLHILINLFRSEREAMPARHEARIQALERGRKQAIREVLQEVKLDAETVFALLKTPIGPGRGQVMAEIHELVRNPDSSRDFGEHTPELKRRAKVAHQLLQDQNLSL